MLKAHVGPALGHETGQGRSQSCDIAAGHQPQDLLVPTVVAGRGECIFTDIDRVPKKRAGQIADPDYRSPLASTPGLGGGQTAQFLGQPEVVVQVVGGDQQRQPAVRVQKLGGHNRSGINRKAVIVDRLGFDAGPGRRAGTRPGQTGIDLQVVGQLAVLVPVFVNVEPAQPRPGLPQLVEDRNPLGGVDEQHLGL